MDPFDSYKGNLKWLKSSTILLTKHGSQAYGTATPTSDLDLKGVAIPPSEYFLGFANKFEQAEQHEPDMVIYDIRRFMQLAAACNPNIIEVLYTDPQDHLIETFWGKTLISARDRFLSLRARDTFMGYAMGQLKRIRTHRGWLLYPPKEKPTRAAFGLPEGVPGADKQQIGAAEYLNEQGYGYGTNFQKLVDDEKRYRVAMVQWEQYETWKKYRNPARHELETRYGYDTKHGMHLVRLIRMCKEILTEGKVYVKRPDAAELLEIRNGKWSYEQLMEWADRMQAEVDDLAKNSKLPKAPDVETLDDLCCFLTGAVI
jgi:predicted nucleotidyltransferase